MADFVPVVTDGMLDAGYPGLYADDDKLRGGFLAMTAHPDFQRQLRDYVAEQMRGLVAKKTSPDSYHSNERARARVWNACRAETLANIAKWESSSGQ